MTNKTHIVVVLDRSGSMSTVYNETIDGFDEFINAQKGVDGDATVTLVQFDDKYEKVFSSVPVNEVKSIKEFYSPRGMTALLDAIGKTVEDTKKKITKTSKVKRPDRVVVVVITDGYENNSKEYSSAKIRSLIKEQEKGNWEFMFIGANQDAVLTGTEYGFKAGSSVTYNTRKTSHTFKKMSEKVGALRSMSAEDYNSVKFGITQLYNSEDRDELV